ncbi:MAG: Cyclic di-GMP phosphodiesterase response regulator RpfG [Verrucomicrobiota bacterium]
MLERHLRCWGFGVEAVGDGAQALRALESPDAPAIALLDWGMPEVDGHEVCRRIRVQSREQGRAFQYLLLFSNGMDPGAQRRLGEGPMGSPMGVPVGAPPPRAWLPGGDGSEGGDGREAWGGADDVLEKPFRLEELRARLRLAQRVVCLERRALERERRGGRDGWEGGWEGGWGAKAVRPRCRVSAGAPGGGE